MQGKPAGSEAVILLVTQLPAHDHAGRAGAADAGRQCVLSAKRSLFGRVFQKARLFNGVQPGLSPLAALALTTLEIPAHQSRNGMVKTGTGWRTNEAWRLPEEQGGEHDMSTLLLAERLTLLSEKAHTSATGGARPIT